MTYKEKIEYIKNLFKTDLEQAKKEFEEYWCVWDTIGGHHYEGVLLEVEDDDHLVLCTDGITRCV